MKFGDYREDILEHLKERFEEYPRVQPGAMFGHPGFRIINRFFCTVSGDGLMLKVSPSDYKVMLELNEVEPFMPRGTPMGTWVLLTYPDAEDYSHNWHWIEKAMQYIVTDEAAPVKKKSKKAKKG